MVFYVIGTTLTAIDWAVYRLAGEAHCRSAVLLYASSYVTWTFQTHTFSNSIEAVLVSCSLVTILKFKHTRVSTTKLDLINLLQAKVSWAAFALGILCSLGVFFRITFPAFLFPAMISCIPDLLRRYTPLSDPLMIRPQKLILPGLSFFLGSFVSISADTYYFSPVPCYSRPVITPWSNFKYNVNALNLAEHGLHPPWTHLLVNLPCLLGPSLLIPVIAAQPVRMSIKQLLGDICFLCSVSGLILLSSRPHQEFRFLLPIIPLLLVSLSRFLPPNLFFPTHTKANSSPRPRSKSKPSDPLRIRRISAKTAKRHYGWCTAWIIFNLLAGVFMGSLHQSAIVPTTRYLSYRIRHTPFLPVCLHPDNSNLFRQTRMIWHRTYPAPDWLFGQPLDDNHTSIEIFNLGGKWKRLWELLAESAKVPIDDARVEQNGGDSCDAWYVASNNSLQRYTSHYRTRGSHIERLSLLHYLRFRWMKRSLTHWLIHRGRIESGDCFPYERWIFISIWMM
jgi:GPI mannosyltransferase 4